jgi:hypothetical protein
MPRLGGSIPIPSLFRTSMSRDRSVYPASQMLRLGFEAATVPGSSERGPKGLGLARSDRTSLSSASSTAVTASKDHSGST